MQQATSVIIRLVPLGLRESGCKLALSPPTVGWKTHICSLIQANLESQIPSLVKTNIDVGAQMSEGPFREYRGDRWTRQLALCLHNTGYRLPCGGGARGSGPAAVEALEAATRRAIVWPRRCRDSRGGAHPIRGTPLHRRSRFLIPRS